jgi:hypothetical protein
MRIADFADLFERSINEKINQCIDNMCETHHPIYNKSLEVKIEALEWVEGQMLDLVNAKKRRYG